MVLKAEEALMVRVIEVAAQRGSEVGGGDGWWC